MNSRKHQRNRHPSVVLSAIPSNQPVFGRIVPDLEALAAVDEVCRRINAAPSDGPTVHIGWMNETTGKAGYGPEMFLSKVRAMLDDPNACAFTTWRDDEGLIHVVMPGPPPLGTITREANKTPEVERRFQLRRQQKFKKSVVVAAQPRDEVQGYII